jgi:hypothetical protein
MLSKKNVSNILMVTMKGASSMVVKNRMQENLVTYGQMNLIFQSRTLWRDLVTWSRIYLDSRIAGIGTLEDVYNRIYRIPTDFGNIIRLIFGNQAAEVIIQQLSYNVILYRQLVEAMLTGNNESANAITQELYKNADERAKYLASINPFWDETQWRNLIYTFYNFSFQEIVSILTNDPKNVDLFDRYLQFTDTIGDYFAQGLFNYITQSKT